MYELTDPKIIKYLCSKYRFVFSGSMGQNFITDRTVPAIMASEATKDSEGIIEIGPGFGSLTAPLASLAKKVVSIELDKRLEKVLSETLAGFDNVEILWQDFMKTDIQKLLDEKFGGMNVSVAANLPYYITTPALMKLIEGRYKVKRIVVMVQKEVAERLCAQPGGKDYGAVTVTTEYFCDARIIKYVPREDFLPSPKVDSAVINLEIRSLPKVSPEDEKVFFSVVKAAFSQRRKTLANALFSSGKFGSKEDIIKAIEKIGLISTVRGEKLSIEEFCELSNILALNR